MSQEYHHHHHHLQSQSQQQQQQQTDVGNLFNYPNGFDRSTEDDQSTTTVDPTGGGLNPAYESAGMLSEMFNFGHGSAGNNAGPTPELLDYRRTGVGTHEWYGDQHHNQIGEAINAHNSAAAMQLFATNAPNRSPSPPQPPSQPSLQASVDGFHSIGGGVHINASNNPHFWGAHHHLDNNSNNTGELTGIIEGQGLSLSLSSSLQQFEAAKQQAEHNHIMFFNQQHQVDNSVVGPSSSGTNASTPTHFFKNLTSNLGPQGHHNSITIHNLQPMGGFVGPNTSSIGFGSASTSASMGVVNVLRNSKYAKPAQELLEEFCSVGRGHQLKKPKLGRPSSSNNPNSATSGDGGSSSKEPPQLSPSDRIEHQRRKVKLLAMLDEVCMLIVLILLIIVVTRLPRVKTKSSFL